MTSSGSRPNGTHSLSRNYVLLFWHLVTERDVVRFGKEAFERRGYRPHFVSCWNALYGGTGVGAEKGEFRNHPDAVAPASRAEIEQFLDGLAPTDFILMTVPLLKETAWLFRALDDRGLTYSYMWLGKYPTNFPYDFSSWAETRRTLRAMTVDLRQLTLRVWEYAKVLLAVGLPLLHLKGPSLYVRAGRFEIPFYTFVPKLRTGEIIEVGSFDMQWAKLAETARGPLPDGPYGIFLDEAMGHHPDWKIEGGQPENMPAINADIHRTLDRIESDIGMPVVVALHPKSDYGPEEYASVYGDRPAFKNNTAALVQGATFVLGHASTSMGMAVIFNKPVMFLTNRFIRESRDGLYVDYLSAWMNMPAIEMDQLDNMPASTIRIPKINCFGYARYRTNFIHSPDAHLGPIWDHVIDRFEANRPSRTRSVPGGPIQPEAMGTGGH